MSITHQSATSPQSTHASSSEPHTSAALAWLALLAGLGASAGSLWLSLGMELVACPLCFYERSFVFGAAAILLLGLLTGAGRTATLSLLALTLTLAAFGVSCWHVYLDATGKLECPKGILDLGTAPQQGFAAIVLVLVLLLGDVFSRRQTLCCGVAAALGALILGGACAYGCIVSTPKPAKPTKPYDTPVNGCRVPYREPA
jgi:disulfide bond formation protein DsbB